MNKLSSAFLNYKNTKEHYLSNAEETIQKNELRKASELLWGGITQAIKSLASLSNLLIKHHNQFKSFIKELSGEIKDNGKLYRTFRELETLHRNFYDEIISEEEFKEYYKKTYFFLNEIEKLIQKKIKLKK